MPLDADDKKWMEEMVTERVTVLANKLMEVEKSVAGLCEILAKQDENIALLDQRLQTEREVSKAFRKRVGQLEVQIDSLEQYGRRYCVRVEGIPENKQETEEDLFSTLKTELQKLDVNLQRGDLVNFHRLGKPKQKERGPITQQCILRFLKWGPRRAMYGINKKARNKALSIRVHNDLTKWRFETLSAARLKISAKLGKTNECFAYSDINSNLKIRVPTGTAVSFCSLEEVDDILREI